MAVFFPAVCRRLRRLVLLGCGLCASACVLAQVPVRTMPSSVARWGEKLVNATDAATANNLHTAAVESLPGIPDADYWRLQLDLWLGNWYLNQNQLAEAESVYKAVWIVGSKQHHHELEVMVGTNLGLLLGRQLRRPEAVEVLLTSLEVAEQHQLQRRVAAVCLNLTGLLAALSDTAAEARYTRMGYEAAKRSSDTLLQLQTTVHLADFFNYKRHWADSAIAYYTVALAGFRARQDAKSIGLVLNNLAEVYAYRNDHARALACYSQALEAYQSVRYTRGISIAQANLGISHLRLSQLPEAEKWMQQAETQLRAQLPETSGELSNLLERLAELYARTGRYEQAYETLQEFATLRDSVINAQTVQRVVELEAQFAADEREDQIERLTADNRVKSAQLSRNTYWMLLGGAGFVLVAILAAAWFRQARIRKRAAGTIASQNTALMESLDQILAQKEELDALNDQLKEAYTQLQWDHAAKAQELEEARQLQAALLPQVPPKHPDLEIAWLQVTASEVGGDFFDYATANGQPLRLAIGDATGHGLKAAFLVATVKSYFQLLAGSATPAAVLNGISDGVQNLHLEDMFMAFAVLDYAANGQFRFVNAGMPPPVLRAAQSGKAVLIEHYGFLLGAGIKLPYPEYALQMEKGDVLLLQSDGLAEWENAHGEMIGYPRVAEFLREADAQQPLPDFLQKLVRRAEEWVGFTSRPDDLTLVAIRRKQ
jgi:serine phosphatase RsbU (regulator of sigma subunit)